MTGGAGDEGPLLTVVPVLGTHQAVCDEHGLIGVWVGDAAWSMAALVCMGHLAAAHRRG